MEIEREKKKKAKQKKKMKGKLDKDGNSITAYFFSVSALLHCQYGWWY